VCGRDGPTPALRYYRLMRRRDLIGMKCRARITVARRRAVPVVAGTRSSSRMSIKVYVLFGVQF
jgi:hypothetical protein